MLQATDIACVRGGRHLFRNLSFRVDSGSALRVQGENGAGKTSLLRIVSGLSPAADGYVSWKGESIFSRRDEYLRNVLFLGHANALKDDLTSSENLRHTLAVAGVPATDVEVLAALDGDGLGHVAHLPVQWLSQGQKRRVALTRLAFGQSRPLWILDEPFSALDAAAVDRLSARLARHLTDGGIVVYTTHQEVGLAAPMISLELQ